MLDYIGRKDRDEVFTTSLIRLIPSSGDPKIVPALLGAMKDPYPLVRSAAADALQNVPTEEAVQALVKATTDDYRLVRIRAASSLAQYPNLSLDDLQKKSVNFANAEYIASLTSRPDQWSSYYNLGNYYMNRADPGSAISSYDTALRLEPQAVMAMVNESMAYARLGETKKSEASLQKALKIAPENAAANFNMRLLKAEQNDLKGAEKYLKAALKYDPQMAQAAYNLCIITSKDRINDAVMWCKQAADLRPQEPRYAYTLAFYLNKKGDTDGAIKTLKPIVDKYPGYKDARLFLEDLLKKEKVP
jgi:tetratricopeptide (TPR) repeat protein